MIGDDVTIVLCFYADHLGMRSDLAGTLPVWDGNTLHTGRFTDNSDLAHELAHWVLATPDQRAQPNFGLGDDWAGGAAALDVDDTTRLEIEGQAAALGISYLKVLVGDDWTEHLSIAGEQMAADPHWAPRWSEHCAAVADHTNDLIRFLHARKPAAA
jgi:hypothetical protein